MQGNITDYGSGKSPAIGFAAIRRSLYANPDITYANLVVEFGEHVYRWPEMALTTPTWWHFKQRERERQINRALAAVGLGPITDGMRAEYWRQIHLGQDIFEDAGGYLWRCWSAAIGLDYAPALLFYRDIISPVQRLAS